MSDTGHSKLFAPSSSHRWMRCTASPHAALRYKDEPGEAAMEGTAAHWLLEKCLTDGTDPISLIGHTLTVRQGQIERKFTIDREMANNVFEFGVRPIREVALRSGLSRVEVKVQLHYIHEDLFGRTDVWHLGEDRWLTVFDFKYGRVDVSPIENEQLMLYALGIFREHVAPNYGLNINGVNLVIAQPRSLLPGPRIKSWTCSLDALLHFEEKVKAAVHEVLHAPQFRPGDWCGYCPALGECPPTREQAMSLGPLLATAQMGPLDAAKILSAKKLIEKKMKDAAAVGKEALLSRQEVPGFRLGVSTKFRQWRDEEQAKDALVETFGASALRAPTPAQAENLGPEAKALVERLSFTPEGQPDIVPENDKRAAYVARSVDQMFGG